MWVPTLPDLLGYVLVVPEHPRAHPLDFSEEGSELSGQAREGADAEESVFVL